MNRKSEILCKLTGLPGPPVKSHIIPRAFYPRLDDGEAMIILSGSKDHRPVKNRIGVYDETILTSFGEKILEKYDDYGIKFLQNKKNFRDIRDKKGILFQYSKDFDYNFLKLFFISVLWRASISTRPEFSRISLGSLNEILKEMLLRQVAGDENEFPIILSYFTGYTDNIPIIFPTKHIIDGKENYKIHLGQYMALIQIDGRLTNPSLQYLSLSPKRPLILVPREPSEASEIKAIRRIVKSTAQSVPQWFKELAKGLPPNTSKK